MKERGILFQAPLVRAILAGNKTQTRRLMKPQPVRTLPNEQPLPSPCGDPWTIYRGKGWRWQKSKSWSAFVADEAGPNAFAASLAHHSPYGVRGDRLWVRETFATLTGNGVRTVYRADGEDPRTGWDDTPPERRPAMKWRPAIFLPRAASRITLEITDVRVQRLQDISEDDAKAEGVEPAPFCEAGRAPGNEHVEAFENLWDAINGERASWSSSPWVWAITFRRLETP